jgi:radical SAM superfamily enzyme YgiQ (UPF0313 family)
MAPGGEWIAQFKALTSPKGVVPERAYDESGRSLNVLLVSTYELGRQPFGLAHPAAHLRRLDVVVRTLDLAVECIDESAFRSAHLIAFYLPMHTATRLAVRLVPKVRGWNPAARLAAYGLYAPMNEAYLRRLGVTAVLGGEFEAALIALVRHIMTLDDACIALPGSEEKPMAPQPFVVPDRHGLPALQRYADLKLADGGRRTVGSVEASRGCRHLCRHCPVVPVYRGRFRAIPRAVVLADIRQQVEAGAQHISFGDPDFFNGPTHAMKIVAALHSEFPGVTYDVTIKVEHLLSHRELLKTLKQTGCLFATTAVESVDDAILVRLDKGHTRADFYSLVSLCDEIGLELAPTFVPFTPWTTLEGYLELLNVIAELGLVRSMAPVQLAIRLLIPPGSLLLESDEIRAVVDPLEEERLIYPWRNPDPVVDRLQQEVQTLVAEGGEQPRARLFDEIRALAYGRAGLSAPLPVAIAARAAPAQISEPWYCCAEPTDNQLGRL